MINPTEYYFKYYNIKKMNSQKYKITKMAKTKEIIINKSNPIHNYYQSRRNKIVGMKSKLKIMVKFIEKRKTANKN